MLERYGIGPVRRITWWLLVANTLFALWLLRSLSGMPMVGCRTSAQQTCSTSPPISSPTFVVLTLWFIADLVLGVVWVIDRHRTAEESF